MFRTAAPSDSTAPPTGDQASRLTDEPFSVPFDESSGGTPRPAGSPLMRLAGGGAPTDSPDIFGAALTGAKTSSGTAAQVQKWLDAYYAGGRDAFAEPGPNFLREVQGGTVSPSDVFNPAFMGGGRAAGGALTPSDYGLAAEAEGGAATLGSAGSVLGGVAGGIGAASGLYNLARGVEAGRPGQSLSGAAGAVGGSAALGGATGLLSAGTAGLLGLAAAPAALAGFILSNQEAQKANKLKNQLKERNDIMRGLSIGLPQVQSGASALARLARGEISLEDANQIAAQAAGGGGPLSQYLSSGGAPVRDAGIPAGDTSALTQYTEVAPGIGTSRSGLMALDAMIGTLRTQDALAKAGRAIPRQLTSGLAGLLLNSAGPQFDPNSAEGRAFGYSSPDMAAAAEQGVPAQQNWQGPNPYYNATTPDPGFASAFTPGTSEQALIDYARRFNPNFDSSLLATRLRQLLPVPQALLGDPAAWQANIARLAAMTAASRKLEPSWTPGEIPGAPTVGG
jgi:hypothetical protein